LQLVGIGLTGMATWHLSERLVGELRRFK
jgi:hypothetical protein